MLERPDRLAKRRPADAELLRHCQFVDLATGLDIAIHDQPAHDGHEAAHQRFGKIVGKRLQPSHQLIASRIVVLLVRSDARSARSSLKYGSMTDQRSPTRGHARKDWDGIGIDPDLTDGPNAFANGVFMPQTRVCYAPEFWWQMVLLSRAGRDPDDRAREVEITGQSIRSFPIATLAREPGVSKARYYA